MPKELKRNSIILVVVICLLAIISDIIYGRLFTSFQVIPFTLLFYFIYVRHYPFETPTKLFIMTMTGKILGGFTIFIMLGVLLAIKLLAIF